jgi:hypothetical protein
MSSRLRLEAVQALVQILMPIGLSFATAVAITNGDVSLFFPPFFSFFGNFRVNPFENLFRRMFSAV